MFRYHLSDWWPIYAIIAVCIFLAIAFSASVADFKARCRALGGTPVYSSHNGSQCFAKDNTRIDWEATK